METAQLPPQKPEGSPSVLIPQPLSLDQAVKISPQNIAQAQEKGKAKTEAEAKVEAEAYGMLRKDLTPARVARMMDIIRARTGVSVENFAATLEQAGYEVHMAETEGEAGAGGEKHFDSITLPDGENMSTELPLFVNGAGDFGKLKMYVATGTRLKPDWYKPVHERHPGEDRIRFHLQGLPDVHAKGDAMIAGRRVNSALLDIRDALRAEGLPVSERIRQQDSPEDILGAHVEWINTDATERLAAERGNKTALAQLDFDTPALPWENQRIQCTVEEMITYPGNARVPGSEDERPWIRVGDHEIALDPAMKGRVKPGDRIVLTKRNGKGALVPETASVSLADGTEDVSWYGGYLKKHQPATETNAENSSSFLKVMGELHAKGYHWEDINHYYNFASPYAGLGGRAESNAAEFLYREYGLLEDTIDRIQKAGGTMSEQVMARLDELIKRGDAVESMLVRMDGINRAGGSLERPQEDVQRVREFLQTIAGQNPGDITDMIRNLPPGGGINGLPADAKAVIDQVIRRQIARVALNDPSLAAAPPQAV